MSLLPFFFNMDISLTIYIINLKICVCDLKVLPEGSMSQNFDLGPRFYFMTKNDKHFVNSFNSHF